MRKDDKNPTYSRPAALISDKSLNALYLSTSKNCGKIKGEEGKEVIIGRETLTGNREICSG